MKKLNILRLKDQHGWAYDFIASEQAKYSQHNISCKRLMDLITSDLNGIDILYIPGPNMGYYPIRDGVIKHARKMFPKLKIICGYAGEHDIMYPDADIIVSISAKFYPKLKQMYASRNTTVVFLPESADTEFFVPGEKPKDFTVGWAGRVAPVKRCHLLDQIAYPVKRQSEHGKEFFKEPNRSLEPMKSFYHSISCLVLTSSSEAMPRVVLEAMSCGLPVISTNVGSLPMLVPSDFLVDVHPESEVIRQMNNKLSTLAKDKDLLITVGNANRRYIEENMSWKINMSWWDVFFLNIYENKFEQILQDNIIYRNKFGAVEPSLLK